MLEVEGGDPESCLRILRHEAGHAIDNAYQLRRRADAAAAVRHAGHAVSRVLHAEAVQQELRPAPRPLVRAEPSRRGLRRDLRRLARPAIDVGGALRRMAGRAEARIHGSPDAGRGAPAGRSRDLEAPGRSAARSCARRSASTIERSASTTASTIRTSTRAICATCSPMHRSTRRISRRRGSSGSDPQGSSRHRRELHRQLPVHDRSAHREDHRALSRAESAAHRHGRNHQDRLHGVPDRADDELPAQRTPSSGAMSDHALARARPGAPASDPAGPGSRTAPTSPRRPGGPSTTSSRR